MPERCSQQPITINFTLSLESEPDVLTITLFATTWRTTPSVMRGATEQHTPVRKQNSCQRPKSKATHLDSNHVPLGNGRIFGPRAEHNSGTPLRPNGEYYWCVMLPSKLRNYNRSIRRKPWPRLASTTPTCNLPRRTSQWGCADQEHPGGPGPSE